jgi:hypothetical protein
MMPQPSESFNSSASSIPATPLRGGKSTQVELARLLFAAPYTSLDCKVDARNVVFEHMFEFADGSPERLDLAKDLFTAGTSIVSPEMLRCAEIVMRKHMLSGEP